MKKLLALLFCTVLLLSSFAGCAGGGGGNGASEKITILYPGEESERMTSFLANEFAAKMKEDLDLEVEMIFVTWDQYWDKKQIMLANQEPIDLYWDGIQALPVMVSKQEAQPLDALIEEYGQDLLKVLPMEHLAGGKINGEIYGIPSAYAPSSAMFQLVCLRQDILEAVGMTEVKTAEDLMEFSKKATEQFDYIKGGGDPLEKPISRYFADDQLNFIALDSIVAFLEESMEVMCYYETEAFQELCKFNREMTLAGQYTEDLTIKYNERDSRMQSGNYLWVEGSIGKDLEIIDAVRANAPEAELKSYLLSPEKPKYITDPGGEVLCIPVSSPNPSGAMRFLNWMYSSQENYNFTLYGVEGTDFEIVDGRIRRLIADELFYEWMFRNKSYQMFAEEVSQEYIDMYNSWDDDAKISKAFGFRFNNEGFEEMEDRLKEAAKLIEPLRTGFVDFETEYPKAIQALKDAGIDEYVAEVRRQVEAYIAAQA